MVGLLDKLCSAIAYEEGFFVPGSRSQRQNNPGDLRSAPWLVNPTIEGGYWKADSAAQGIAGLYHQVALDIARGYSLTQLIHAWAPAADGNDPQSYIKNVMLWTGITDATAPLWTVLELTKPG